mmetsp:Transcript_14691/g.37277  ORF Transcript_14691/g.37277 Transcript_14691/m.37277 type:complete len:203 (-) Transcript_14691:125-733(-)
MAFASITATYCHIKGDSTVCQLSIYTFQGLEPICWYTSISSPRPGMLCADCLKAHRTLGVVQACIYCLAHLRGERVEVVVLHVLHNQRQAVQRGAAHVGRGAVRAQRQQARHEAAGVLLHLGPPRRVRQQPLQQRQRGRQCCGHTRQLTCPNIQQRVQKHRGRTPKVLLQRATRCVRQEVEQPQLQRLPLGAAALAGGAVPL